MYTCHQRGDKVTLFNPSLISPLMCFFQGEGPNTGGGLVANGSKWDHHIILIKQQRIVCLFWKWRTCQENPFESIVLKEYFSNGTFSKEYIFLGLAYVPWMSFISHPVYSASQQASIVQFEIKLSSKEVPISGQGWAKKGRIMETKKRMKVSLLFSISPTFVKLSQLLLRFPRQTFVSLS